MFRISCGFEVSRDNFLILQLLNGFIEQPVVKNELADQTIVTNSFVEQAMENLVYRAKV